MNLATITSTDKFFLIAGPCAVESEDICFEIAEQLVAVTSELNIPFIYKASFKKANRTKLDSFITIGEEKALQILSDVKAHFNIPILTDVHETTDCDKVKDIVDDCVDFAEKSPLPDVSEVYKDIYVQEDYPFIVD